LVRPFKPEAGSISAELDEHFHHLIEGFTKRWYGIVHRLRPFLATASAAARKILATLVPVVNLADI